MKRLFNLKMGISPSNEKLPQILLRPFSDGGSAGRTPNYDQLRKKFYEYRDWNLETGKPSLKKLKSLGLEDFI